MKKKMIEVSVAQERIKEICESFGMTYIESTDNDLSRHSSGYALAHAFDNMGEEVEVDRKE